MKTLLMTVGLPRSGKSTFLKDLQIPIVNPDAIRLALHGQRFVAEAEAMVWCFAKYMVNSLFLAGHNMVALDATNTNRKRRDEWIDSKWQRLIYEIDTPKEICIERAKECGFLDLIPVIERMDEKYDFITYEEQQGWETNIWVVRRGSEKSLIMKCTSTNWSHKLMNEQN